MQRITIKEDGIYFSFWQEESTDWIEQNINDANFPFAWYLTYPVQIEDGITLKTILSHLAKYKDEIESIFVNALFGVKFNTIYDVINSTKSSDFETQLNVIYLFKIGELLPADKEYNLLRITPVIMGIYLEDEINDEDVYHLSSFPIGNWSDLPIAVDYFMEYVDSQSDEPVLSGVVSWNFFEIVHTILSQISLTLRIMEIVPVKVGSNLESGPMTITELFNWITDLDRILLV